MYDILLVICHDLAIRFHQVMGETHQLALVCLQNVLFKTLLFTGFIFFWGWVFLITTTIVLVFKKEVDYSVTVETLVLFDMLHNYVSSTPYIRFTSLM